MPTPSPSAGVVLFAKDIKRVAKFYEILLDLNVVHAAADHIVLESSSAALVIHGIPAKIAAGISIKTPPQVREETAIKPFFMIPSLAAARGIAESLGGKIAPATRQWSARGFTACDGHDPEGNVIQLRQTMDHAA